MKMLDECFQCPHGPLCLGKANPLICAIMRLLSKV